MPFQEVEASYLFMVAVSAVILIICLLTGFYLGIEELQAIGVIYAVMLLTSAAVSQKIEVEKNVLKGLVAGVPALFGISLVFGFCANQWRIMGLLTVTEWPVIAAAKHPVTLRLGTLAVTLGITPEELLTVLINIPGPVAEETFFRIYLMNTVTPSMGEKKTILGQAIGFGFVHWIVYGMDPWGIITATAAGLALGINYSYYGSELAVVLSHIVFNEAAVLIAGGLA